jgi:hypothetical protein
MLLQHTDQPQSQTSKRSYQQCMSNFQSSTVGKVIQFGSLLSFFDNAWGAAKEWGTAFLVKGGYLKIAETAGQSLQSAGEITPVTTVVKPLVGDVATVGVILATGADAQQRLVCAGVIDPNQAAALGAPIMPIFP